MPVERRVQLISQIEKVRGTKVLTYVTSTRKGLEVKMAMDSVRKIYEHLLLLEKSDPKPKIDLFLYSNGGDGTVPWRLVTLIREFTDEFSVIVPYRAFSAATLTALGADAIIMHPMGMLGPTDATVTNAFNPDTPDGKNKLGISGEDVSAYIALIREDVGIRHEDELVEAFKCLAEKVHPLALGNVRRSLSQSRMMASKLLSLHMDKTNEKHKINDIVDKLTSKLFYHGHPINRDEASSEIELRTIKNPPEEVEKLIWDLYLDYEAEMNMDEPFNPQKEFMDQFPTLAPGMLQRTPEARCKFAYIESAKRTDTLYFRYIKQGVLMPNLDLQLGIIALGEKWELERNI